MAHRSEAVILVVDDDETIRLYLKTLFQSQGYRVLAARSGPEALELMKGVAVDVVLLDLVLADGESGIDVLKQIKSMQEEIDVVVVSGVKSVKMVVSAVQVGASDYIAKPIEKEELFLAIARVFEKRRLRRDNLRLKEESTPVEYASEIIGRSPRITELKSTVARLRGQAVNVFIVGETGTGKEMFARLLHRQENDPNRPFVSVNCAAIPANLIESVLFGHEKGSFTGATERRIGKFELADGGDIFLDEISCLSPELQAKLLRVLEEKEVERVGGSAPKKVNFRVISASNENIHQLVREGRFRPDLFYRLNAVTLDLPGLDDRQEDIAPLAEHFLWRYRRSQAPKKLSPEVKEILRQHTWRGNVRELRNTVENMIVFSQGETILPADIPFLRNGHGAKPTPLPEPMVGATLAVEDPADYAETLRRYERDLLLKKLEQNRWSKTRTCRELGISRNKLYRKMSQLGITL